MTKTVLHGAERLINLFIYEAKQLVKCDVKTGHHKAVTVEYSSSEGDHTETCQGGRGEMSQLLALGVCLKTRQRT